MVGPDQKISKPVQREGTGIGGKRSLYKEYQNELG